MGLINKTAGIILGQLSLLKKIYLRYSNATEKKKWNPRTKERREEKKTTSQNQKNGNRVTGH
jgi:hypothetical protein